MADPPPTDPPAANPLDDRAALLVAQTRSTALAKAWRAGKAYAEIAAAFDAVACDDAEAVAVVAQRLLSDPDTLLRLIEPLVTALRDDCWFEPPFRASRDPLRTGAVLFEHPAVAISAAVLSAATLSALPEPAPEQSSVTVSGRLVLTCYARGGGARLRLWSAEPAEPDFSSALARPLDLLGTVKLDDGMVLRIDGRTRAARVEGATSDVVTITAVIRAGVGPFVREYALPSGKLARLATNDDGAARTQMLLTYLRHAKRADAGPSFDAATRDGAFFLRWAAMREWLALDALAAFPRLHEMVDDPNPEVREAAAATLPIVEAACRS